MWLMTKISLRTLCIYLALITSMQIIPATATPVSPGCTSSVVATTTNFCDVTVSGGVLYNSVAAYCTAKSDTFGSLNYLKIAETTFCEDEYLSPASDATIVSLQSCHQYISNNTQDDLVYFKYNAGTVCSMTKGEYCYRAIAEKDSFSPVFTLQSPYLSDGSEPQCCSLECKNDYPFTNGACGNNGNTYANQTSLCNAYCENRTLVFAPACGTNGSVDCTNYPGCTTSCSTLSAGNSACGSDGNVYTNANLCPALNDKTITSYSECNGSCSTANCKAFLCELNLDKINYVSSSVCGSSGNFYTSQENYCTAYANGTENYYFLCNNSTCNTSAACCSQYCNTHYKSYSTFCDSNQTFYSSLASFCTSYCGNTPITLDSTCGANCSQTECCNLNCLSEPFLDTCINSDYSLYTKSSYCTDSCTTTAQASTSCNTNGTARACQSSDCQVMQCNANNSNCTNGLKLCGQLLGEIASVSNYCDALIVTNTETGLLNTNSNKCMTSNECKIALCIYQESSGFYSQCVNSSTFIYYTDVTSFCTDSVNNNNNTVFTEYLCSGDTCTQAQCCQLNCSTATGKAFCDSSFTLQTSITACNDQCNSETPGPYTCNGGCQASDCANKECLNDMNNYSGGVCLFNGNNYVNAYSTVSSACTVYSTNTSYTYYECPSDTCSSLDETYCKYIHCMETQTAPSYTTCTTDYSKIATLDDYCSALYLNNETVALCGSVGNQTNCTEKQCCDNECVSDNIKATCSIDYYWIYSASEYCTYRCDTSEPYRQDIVVNSCSSNGSAVDCGPSDCANFKCLSQNNSVSLNPVCYQTNNNFVFYTTLEGYCTSKNNLSLSTDFTINNSLTCANTCTQTGCCKANCTNVNSSYNSQCDASDYSLVTLDDYCTNVCDSSSPTYLSCSGNCSQNDCYLKDCESNASSFSNVCLKSSLADSNFYAIADYCNAVVPGQTSNFELGNAEINCGDSINGCSSAQSCCYHLCTNETFHTSCDPSSFTLVTQADFCNYRCATTNTSQTDMTVDTCPYSSSGTDCSDCKIFNCLNTISSHISTICMDNTSTGIFYSTKVDYCNAMISSNSSSYDIAHDTSCSGGCTSSNDCCLTICNSNTSFTPGCDSNYNFIDQAIYCNAFCGSGAPTLKNCSRGTCNATECAYEDCMNTTKPTYSKICLASSVNGSHFFSSFSDLCSAKATASDNNYTNLGEVYCGTTGRCSSAIVCDNQLCLNGSYTPVCDKNGYDVATQKTYCDYKYSTTYTNNISFYVHECSNEQNQIACTTDSCNIADCVATLTSSFGPYSKMCSTSGTFYSNLSDFCNAVDGYTGDVELCSGSVCSNANNCCLSVCNSQNTYTPVCIDTTFDMLSTLSDYCNVYCPSGTIDLYKDSNGNNATQSECSIQKCISEGGINKPACNASSFQLVSSVSQCSIAAGSGINLTTCPSPTGCTQADCDQMSCVSSLTSTFSGLSSVCASDGTYLTFANYCTDKYINNTVSNYITCNGSGCANATSCSIAYCETQNSNYSVTCSANNFTIYNTVSDFCTAYVTIPNFAVAQCSGHNCTATECCVNACENSAYSKVCTSSPESSLLSLTDYCTNTCNNSNYANTVQTCNGDCTATNCSYFDCVYYTTIIFDTQPVCGQNMILYSNTADYCNAVINNDVSNYYLCSGFEICTSASQCCTESCAFVNNQEIYQERCDNSYTFYPTNILYCNEICSAGNNYAGDLYCSNGSALCTQQQCCMDDCEASSYPGYCDDSFNYINQQQYCNNFCPLKDYLPVTCAGGCDASDCNIMRCRNDLIPYSYTSVCLKNASGAPTFYSSLYNYCDAVESNATSTYSITGDTGCGSSFNQNCADGTDCCEANCEINNPHSVCNHSTFAVVSNSSYCTDYCGSQTLTIDRCQSNGSDIDCANCNYFQCLANLSGYPYKVCGEITNTVTLFDDVNSFCLSAASVSETNYTSLKIDCKDTNGNVIQCPSSNDCKIAACERDNSATYLNKCNSSSYLVVDLNQYCTNTVNSPTTTYTTCSGAACTQTNCNFQYCMTYFTGSDSICLDTAIYSYFYYSTPTDYCNAASTGCDISTTTCTTQYDVAAADETLCNGSACSSTSTCCIQKCINDTYSDSCAQSDYHLVDQTEYCNYRCSASNISNNSYTDMSIYNCSSNGSTIDCTANLCKIMDCEDTLLPTYSSNNVCGSGYYYDTLNNFCTYFVGDMTKIVECSGSTCAEASTCCNANCANDSSAESNVCSTQEYTWRADKTAYCSEYCTNNAKIFTTYTVTGSNATQTQCNIQYCIVNDLTWLNACDTRNYTVITLDQNCTDIYGPNNTTPPLQGCDGNACVQSDCDYMKCIADNGGASATNFCVQGGTFYSTVQSLCTGVGTPYAYTAISTCDGASCTSSTSCCHQDCENNHTNFSPICSNDYVLYPTASAYCTDVCSPPSTSWAILQCSGSNCNNLQCEIAICKHDSYTAVCTPAYVLLNQVDYCTDNYTNSRSASYYHQCTGGACTQDQCNIDKCLATVVASYTTSQNVCGLNETLYTSPTDFCNAYSTNTSLAPILCTVNGSSVICPDATACCQTACGQTNLAGYAPRCDTAYSWLSTVSEYCQDHCAATYSPLYCPSNSTTFCTQNQCCNQDCNAGSYTARCSSTYQLLSQSDYCTLDCSTDTSIPCTGACTQPDCNTLNCENMNSSFGGTSICFISSPISTYYFNSLSTYCSAVGSNDSVTSSSYLIQNANLHDCGSSCASERDCYIANCTPGKFATCNASAYTVLSPSGYCGDKYDNDLPTLDICYTAGTTTQIDCTSCDYFKCMDQINSASYPYISVCANNSGAADYYTTISDYCIAAASPSVSNYVTPIIPCVDSLGSLIECGNADKCTVQVCIDTNSSSYQNLCKESDYSLWTVSDNCNALLTSTYDSTGCAGSPEYLYQNASTQCMTTCSASCTNTNCRYQDCMTNESTSISSTGICFDAKPKDVYFYTSFSSFCTDASTNNFNSYLATSSQAILCNGNDCANADNCCIARCLLDKSVPDYCDPTSYALQNNVDYCTHRCQLSGVDNDSYTNPSTLLCYDSSSNVIACAVSDCKVFQCLDDLTNLSYPYTSVCLNNQQVFTPNQFFFATEKSYCSYLVSNSQTSNITTLPSYLGCNSSSCADYPSCCVANCETASIDTFCSSTYQLTTESEFCTYKCKDIASGTINSMTMKTCTGDCTTCKYIKCKDDINANISNLTICSVNAEGGNNYFSTVDAYCLAVATNTNEAQAVAIDYHSGFDQVLCTYNGTQQGCQSSNDCCNALCNNETFYDYCDSTFTLFTNQVSYCSNNCNSTPLTLTGCYDNSNNQIDCTNLSCCEKKYTHTYASICGSDGVLYSTVNAFCTAIQSSGSLTEYVCDPVAGCTASDCYINKCLNDLTAQTANGSLCDIDNKYYATGLAFCQAKYLEQTLDYIHNSCVPNCTNDDCCALVSSVEEPVIVYSDSLGIVARANAQIAKCESLPIIYTCTSTTLSACLTEFNNLCQTFCQLADNFGDLINQPAPSKNYCGQTDGYYSSLDYCMLFTCTSSNWYNTFVANSNCDTTPCGSKLCSEEQCVYECTPAADVCGIDGKIYAGECILGCFSVTKAYDCSTVTGSYTCAQKCEYDACVTSVGSSNLQYSCANTTIYDDQCKAQVAGATFHFTCPVDECTNAVRMNRCTFDCDNGEFGLLP